MVKNSKLGEHISTHSSLDREEDTHDSPSKKI